MRRSLVFALMLSLGHASVAVAGETLLESGKRITRQVVKTRPAPAVRPALHPTAHSPRGGDPALHPTAHSPRGGDPALHPTAHSPRGGDPALHPTAHSPRGGDPALQAQGTLAQSGMRARNKFLIGLGIAVAFAGVALAIDGGVEDSTPSSRGER